MATTPSLLRSCPPLCLGQLASYSPPFSVQLSQGGRIGRGSVSVKVTTSPAGIVLLDKSDSEKVNRLKTRYDEEIIPLLQEEFNYKNKHEVPKLVKVVLNCGIGDASQNAKGLDAAVNDLALIAGQRPVKTRAKESNAAFKIREGQPLGIAVTLRRKLMYNFLDRLINIGFPRSRDFLGVNPNSFDGQGNFNIGVPEQAMFPEIIPEITGKLRGMDICIVTTAKNDTEAMKLLTLLGMPFREASGPATPVRKKKLKAHHFSTKGAARGKGKGKR